MLAAALLFHVVTILFPFLFDDDAVGLFFELQMETFFLFAT